MFILFIYNNLQPHIIFGYAVLNELRAKILKISDKVSTLNVMPEASYWLDINLEKLMYCAIATIHKHERDKNIAPSNDNVIQIKDETFYELLYGIDEQKNLKDSEYVKQKRNNIQKVRRIMQRAYDKFDASPVMEIYEDGKDHPSKVPMILKLEYDKTKKTMNIQLAKEFYEYFYNLSGKSFNVHTIKQIMHLDSSYSLRFYRIFNSVKWRTKTLILSYDEIRRIFKKIGMYEKHSHMKALIEPAISDINAHTNLMIEFDYIKSGANYDAVEFRINSKSTKRLSSKMRSSLIELKNDYSENGIPWSDDFSHFKDPNRNNYFDAPTNLTEAQIKFLLTSDSFLNDYSFAYSGLGQNLSKSVAQAVLKPLLESELDALNKVKKIDLDYYFALSYSKKPENPK